MDNLLEVKDAIFFLSLFTGFYFLFSFLIFLIFFSVLAMIAASDYYNFDDLLTSEEKALRMKVRECMEKEVAPIMAEVFFIFHSCPFSYLLLFICLISLIFYWFCFSWFLAKYLFKERCSSFARF